MNKEELINFTAKLIDREIQYHKATGFTLWALIAFVILIGNNILKNGLIIFNDSNINNYFFLISADIINIGYFLICIFISLLIFSLRQTQKLKIIKPRLEIAFSPIVYIPTSLTFLFYSYLNFRAAAISNVIWIYLFISILYFINGSYGFLKKVVYFVKRKRNIRTYKEIPGFESWTESALMYTYIGVFIFAAICLFLVYINIQIRNINWDTNIVNQLIAFSAEIFILNAALIMICYKIKSYFVLSELTKLEKDIFLNDLSAEKIKERLEIDFFGTLPSQFLSKYKEEMKNKLQTFSSHLDVLEKTIIELKKQGKSKEIKKEKKKVEKQYVEMMHIYISTLRSLLKMPLSSDETEDVKNCINDVAVFNEPIVKKLENVCKI